MKNKVLVIAPHADDEILGCGGTIAKRINNGDEVYVAIMTNAHKGDPGMFPENKILNVRSEAKKAHKFLGIKNAYFFDFPAPKLDQFPQYKIAIEISKLIKELKINIMYIPYRGDIHVDHKIIFDAAMVASRPNYDAYTVKSVFAYETLSETEWGHPFSSDAFIPNHYETISESCFNKKLKALNFFESQVKEFPNSRSIEAVEALAKFRGATIRFSRAEAFMVLRCVN